MRTSYHEQLRKHLEPENNSLQSKSKSITTNSQQGSAVRANGASKMKQELFHNQRPQDSFGSFDAPVLN